MKLAGKYAWHHAMVTASKGAMLLAIALLSCKKTVAAPEAEPDGHTAFVAAQPASSDSVHIDDDSFFLLRRLPKSPTDHLEVAAIRVDRTTPVGMDYECFYDGGGTGQLRGIAARRGTVGERVAPTSDKRVYSTAGGVLDIICGTFKVEWSKGNWIYLHDSSYFRDDTRSRPDLDLADPGKKSLEEINVFDRRLRWLTMGSN